ncbi:hypothetical protein L1987_02165 [Smallanthus sonchifolius]|uniref:Uncharacterized protein n=1 Tax=Smallanthus sonchifolius TaxID=185202 RepID=A0ACB9K745_9ASTR|nr:hypothetical protein L1987_02165 [Smallanthus sonchifolius]
MDVDQGKEMQAGVEQNNEATKTDEEAGKMDVDMGKQMQADVEQSNETTTPDNQHEIAIKSLPGNVKVEIPPTFNNFHVKQEPLDKKPLKLEIPSNLKLEGTIHEDLPPFDGKDVLVVPPSIISEDHSPPHPFFDFGPFDDNWV